MVGGEFRTIQTHKLAVRTNKFPICVGVGWEITRGGGQLCILLGTSGTMYISRLVLAHVDGLIVFMLNS